MLNQQELVGNLTEIKGFASKVELLEYLENSLWDCRSGVNARDHISAHPIGRSLNGCSYQKNDPPDDPIFRHIVLPVVDDLSIKYLKKRFYISNKQKRTNRLT